MNDVEKALRALARTTPPSEVLAAYRPQAHNHMIETKDNRIQEILAGHDPVKRHATLAHEWENLLQDAQARDCRAEFYPRGGPMPHAAKPKHGERPLMPMAANTYTATLITAFLLDGSVTVLQNKLAALRAFSREFTTDRYKPKATAQAKKVTAGGTTQTDASNFESGNSTVTNQGIAVSQYTQSFQVSNSDLNSGLRMQDLVNVNAATFGDAIIQAATAPITEANFANYNSGSYVSAPAAFGWSDMALLWGALKKANFKNAILDGEYIAMLNNTPTYFQDSGVGGSQAMKFGWNEIALNTNWTSAGAGVRGFACDPQAIGAVSGLPLSPAQVGFATPSLIEGTVKLPGIEMTVASYLWFSLATRTLWASFDVIFGADKLDTTAGVIIKAS